METQRGNSAYGTGGQLAEPASSNHRKAGWALTVRASHL